jgi:hypothetical protein
MPRKGGNKKSCDRYKAEGRLERNKARNIARDLRNKEQAQLKKEAV